MGRQELVSPEVLGSDEELRAAARQTSAGSGLDDEAEGRDPARAVAVRVDQRGRVTDVLISAWWRDDLTPATLPGAVLSAYQAALAQATTHLRPRDADSPPTAEPPASPDDDYEGDDHGWLLSVRRRLDQAEEALARSGELLHEGTGPQRVVAGPAGLVRLVLVGPTVAEVLIDTHSALRESPNRLAADALAAFQSID